MMRARLRVPRKGNQNSPFETPKKKTKKFNFVMNDVEKHRLETLAKEQKRTMGGVIRHIIRTEWKKFR